MNKNAGIVLYLFHLRLQQHIGSILSIRRKPDFLFNHFAYFNISILRVKLKTLAIRRSIR